MTDPADQASHAVFDTRLIRAHLDRATATGRGEADYLLAAASEELADRLDLILRQFELGVDVTAVTTHGAQALAASGKVSGTLCLAPTSRIAGSLVSHASSSTRIAAADPETLPLASETCDLAVSLLGLTLVNDLPGALVQVRRALRPDGLFLAALLGGNTLSELREVLLTAEAEGVGGVSPRIAPFADLRDMGALLQRAGFALPVTDVQTLTVRYGSPLTLLQDLRSMGATNPLLARSRTPLRRDVLMRAMALYQERFSDSDGKVRATFDIIWVSGWAPHDSQQKPLRPGSARTRLADALGTDERPAGDKVG
ncbi:MAG: methyltransferase domain-containing protein [Pseudomonadota bacterium]